MFQNEDFDPEQVPELIDTQILGACFPGADVWEGRASKESGISKQQRPVLIFSLHQRPGNALL